MERVLAREERGHSETLTVSTTPPRNFACEPATRDKRDTVTPSQIRYTVSY